LESSAVFRTLGALRAIVILILNSVRVSGFAFVPWCSVRLVK
jgi:hypothetical protein